MNEQIRPCPVCGHKFEELELPKRAPGLAEALGMDPDALRVQHFFQMRRQREDEMRAHLSKHGPEEWVPLLVAAQEKLRLVEAVGKMARDA